MKSNTNKLPSKKLNELLKTIDCYLFKITEHYDRSDEAVCIKAKVIYQENEVREYKIKLYNPDLVKVTGHLCIEQLIFEKLKPERIVSVGDFAIALGLPEETYKDGI